MLFYPLLIIGILFYFTDKRVLSALIFFFFVCDGFQLVPLSLFDTRHVINKAPDFALLYIVGIFIVGLFKYRDFITKNKLATAIWIFLAFVFVNMCINKFIYGVPWNEILKTSRYFFFVLSYFVFRRLTKEEILLILKILVLITAALCFIYVIQSFTGRPLLTGATKKGVFGKINRYYNIPYLYYFFLYFAFFSNPLKGGLKYTSIGIFILVAIVSLHRGLMVSIFLTVFLGIFLQGGFKGVSKYILIAGLVLVPFAENLTERFANKTESDIDNVMAGAFQEYGEEISVDGTFLFRMALFYERYEYVTEMPIRMVFGAGLMTEGSSAANTFDFKIGLKNEVTDETIQLDTADIAWVNFMLRLGFVGTFIYLYLYFTLVCYFYKNRKSTYPFIGFLYMLLLLLISITSSSLYDTYMILLPMLLFILIFDKENDLLKIEDKKDDD
ncbi:hypothetical protein [Viscerimonas tarda]